MITQGPLAPSQVEWVWAKAFPWTPRLSLLDPGHGEGDTKRGAAYLREDLMLATGLGQPWNPLSPLAYHSQPAPSLSLPPAFTSSVMGVLGMISVLWA